MARAVAVVVAVLLTASLGVTGAMAQMKTDPAQPKMEQKSDRMGQRVEGTIKSFNAGANTFVVGGVTVQVTSTTTYETLDKMITQADFFGTDRTGQLVIVGGTETSSNTIAATRIELKSH